MMSRIERITDAADERLHIFAGLTEAQLRQSYEAAHGVMIVESPKVIRVALQCGMKPLALLCEERHLQGDAADRVEQLPADTPIYIGEREVLARLTGYTLTRGVLCAMARPAEPSVEQATAGARRVAVIDGVCDTTNIGAIFRAVAAMGVDAVLLTPTSCDPLNRRSIRVSMGTTFMVPWTWLREPVAELRRYGLATVAMALTSKSVAIDDAALNAERRLAIVLGTEGDGLAREVIASTDYVARIPMHHGVDSLNVAAAAAVAFWQLRVKD